MYEKNAIHGLILQRFNTLFQKVTYRGVPLSKYVYRRFMSYLNGRPSAEYLPYLQEALPNTDSSSLYQWLDEPYSFDANSNGVVLMRGGFGDLAVNHLPKERIFMICPNQAEVDLIKLNRPDLIAHSIKGYFRDNPAAVRLLNRQIAKIIQGNRSDPFFGSPELLKWFESGMPEFVRMLDAVHLLFKGLDVAAVLTISSTYSMDGALNLVAKANRVPSFTLQHGIIAEEDLYAHVPILATKKLVWGKAMVDWYRRFGFPESRMAAIGSPRFDIIFNRTWFGKAQLCQKLGIDPHQRLIVYGADVLRIEQLVTPVLLEGLQGIPNHFLLIMLHPGDNPEPHKQLAAGYPNCKVVQFGHICFYDALSGADLFITCYSTAALEAMFFKIPIITVEPFEPTFSYGRMGVTTRVTNAAELKQAMERLAAEPNLETEAVAKYQRFIAEYCIPDGNASQRLFDEVNQLVVTGGTA